MPPPLIWWQRLPTNPIVSFAPVGSQVKNTSDRGQTHFDHYGPAPAHFDFPTVWDQKTPISAQRPSTYVWLIPPPAVSTWMIHCKNMLTCTSIIYWYSLHIWFHLAFLYRDKSTLWLPHTLRLGWYAIEIDYLYSIKSEFWQYQLVF